MEAQLQASPTDRYKPQSSLGNSRARAPQRNRERKREEDCTFETANCSHQSDSIAEYSRNLFRLLSLGDHFVHFLRSSRPATSGDTANEISSLANATLIAIPRILRQKVKQRGRERERVRLQLRLRLLKRVGACVCASIIVIIPSTVRREQTRALPLLQQLGPLIFTPIPSPPPPSHGFLLRLVAFFKVFV